MPRKQWLSRVYSGTGRYTDALLSGLPYTDGELRPWNPKGCYQGGAEILGDRGIELRTSNGAHAGWMPTSKRRS